MIVQIINGMDVTHTLYACECQQILKCGQGRSKCHVAGDNNVQGFQRVRVKGVVDDQQAVDRVGGGSPNEGSAITAFRRPKARVWGPLWMRSTMAEGIRLIDTSRPVAACTKDRIEVMQRDVTSKCRQSKVTDIRLTCNVPV
jgi:hypothetical protein